MLAYVAGSTREAKAVQCATIQFSVQWRGTICRTRKGFPEFPRAIFRDWGKSTVYIRVIGGISVRP